MSKFILIAGWVIFFAGTFIVILFLYSSLRERKFKATATGLLLFLPFQSLLLTCLLIHFPMQIYIMFGVVLIISISVLLLILPFHDNSGLSVNGEQKRIDERNAIFHRFYRLKRGMPEFEQFYLEHPEKYVFDEKVRALPDLGSPGSRSYNPFTSPYQIAAFTVLESISREIEWQPCPPEDGIQAGASTTLTQRLKGFANYLGADFVGATKLNSAYVYSHIGRSSGKWGAPIVLNHGYALVVGVEMNYEMVQQAPESATTTETAFKYVEVAKVALIIAKYLNLLGYDARSHVDGNYRVMCVPIAVDAGLGELSRMGLLIHPQFGPRVRLAVVTTNAPLAQDNPIAFGVQHFCSICRKCAQLCPSGAIDAGEKKMYNGAEKWQSSQEKCYRFWRLQGTDCSICVKVCPYSYPDSLLHNMIRWLTRRNNFSRLASLKGDEFFYGRDRSGHLSPPQWHESHL